LQARPGDFLFFGEFPSARDIANLLRGEDVRRDWRRLCAALQACGTSPRVPGSFGWQHLTGLPYVRSTSDIDLTIAVQDAHQADAVVALLQAWPEKGPRLDGELVFVEDAAIAWREWQAWRAGRVRTVLVKDLHGSRLCAQPVPMTDGEAVLA
jgi:phosphoribosyl-dephospho-CoA transferase